MSCHFHMLRRRRLAEAKQKAAETARKAELAKADKEVAPEPEPARKAAKSRRKGDA